MGKGSFPFAPDVEKPRSSANLHFHRKHGTMMPDKAKVGGPHKMTVTGTIRGLRQDDYGSSMDMDVDSVTHGDEQPKSLTQAMKKRNRHMATGRFTS